MPNMLRVNRMDNPDKPATLDTQTENEDKHNNNPQHSTEH